MLTPCVRLQGGCRISSCTCEGRIRYKVRTAGAWSRRGAMHSPLVFVVLIASVRNARAGDCAAFPPPPPLTPVTHDITSPSGESAPELLRQELREIPRDSTQLASARRVPFEPHQKMDADRLQWEETQTRNFLNKQLSRDPRLQPNDIVVNTGHMSSCTSCEHDEGQQTALHGMETIDIGTRTQPMVDDWPVHSWQNIVRFINPPQSKDPLDLDNHDDARFGCPCSAFETETGDVQLTYQSGPSIFGAPDDSWEEDHNGRYSYRRSADGVGGWTSEAGPINVNGHDTLGTIGIVGGGGVPFSLPARGHGEESRITYLAGYEGWRGRACFAGSSDGVHFRNINSRSDQGQAGLNDDCLTSGHYAGSNSILARAADTYIVPIIDEARSREYIWYRKDFGTSFGWREVRGMQVVELDKRFAEIDTADSMTNIATKHTDWYLDRLGKLERYRRHVYAVSLTPYSQDLWLGLMTIIEWPKDLDEEHGSTRPAFERDTLNVYLITSRDGVHIDHEWVYAHQPLLPKDGLTQADYDGGFLFPAASFLTREHEHRIYFEARAGIHHEERYRGNKARLATAAWTRDRLAGLRPAHTDVAGVITTKAFRLDGGSVRLEVDTRACGSAVRVAVCAEDGSTLDGRSLASAIVIEGEDGAVQPRWTSDNLADGERLGEGAHAVAAGQLVRLQFEMTGDAKLYAFQIVSLPPAPSPLPKPPPPASPSPAPPVPLPPVPPPPSPSPGPRPPVGWPVAPPHPSPPPPISSPSLPLVSPKSPALASPPSSLPPLPQSPSPHSRSDTQHSGIGAPTQQFTSTGVTVACMVVGAALSAVGFFLWRCARTHLEAAERGEKVARDEHADERSTRKLQAVRSAYARAPRTSVRPPSRSTHAKRHLQVDIVLHVMCMPFY